MKRFALLILAAAALPLLAACETMTATATVPGVPATATTAAVPAMTVTTTTTTPLPDTIIDQLAKVAVPDLQGASALALAQSPPDLVANACWTGLEPIVTQIQAMVAAVAPPTMTSTTTVAGAPTPPLPPSPGAANANRARRRRRGGRAASFLAAQSGQLNGLEQQFELACGPLVLDVNNVIANPLSVLLGQTVPPKLP